MLQQRANHQRSKTFFTEFHWIGPYIVDKALPNNNYLVRKVRTDKTQVPHGMRLRPFRPKEPIQDVQTTPQDWKLDLVVTFKHDGLYARAWECDIEKSFLDNDQDEQSPRNPSQLTVESSHTNVETCSALETLLGKSSLGLSGQPDQPRVQSIRS